MRGDGRSLCARFEAGTLAPDEFSHEDHVRVAFDLLQRHEFLEATARFGRGARALAARSGVPERFNATITLAFLALIRECMVQEVPASAEALLQQYPQLTHRGLLSRWYSSARLASPLARQAFVLPDRAPG
ncbi:MAG: hypothetical protein AAGA68_11330 [Pseudomonadota bacterium]